MALETDDCLYVLMFPAFQLCFFITTELLLYKQRVYDMETHV